MDQPWGERLGSWHPGELVRGAGSAALVSVLGALGDPNRENMCFSGVLPFLFVASFFFFDFLV